MTTDTEARVKSVDNALDVLDAIVELNGAGVTELADRLEISKSAIYKHLSTLEARGYVVRTENDDYDLSFRWLRFGGYGRKRVPSLQRIQTATRELANETDELLLFATFSNNSSMSLYHSRGEKAVVTDSYTGKDLPLHCTASGKAMLAAMGPDAEPVLDEIELSRHTDNTITDRAELVDELETIRQQGFALEDQERIDGMRGIGAAVTDEHTGEVIGAFALTGPAHRVEGEKFREKYPKLLVNRARELEINITYE
jgi:DNA-binding IclR family transcriptional regulator